MTTPFAKQRPTALFMCRRPPAGRTRREVTLDLPSVPKPAGVSEESLEGMSWREALEPAVGGQLAFRVELTALDGKTFTDEFTVPARRA